MHDLSASVLRDLGVEVECCPTCDMSNWKFIGTVDRGIHTVTCETCGRRYERLSPIQALEHYANKLALACHGGSGAEVAGFYNRLVRAWANAGGYLSGADATYVTYDGRSVADDDDAPF